MQCPIVSGFARIVAISAGILPDITTARDATADGGSSPSFNPDRGALAVSAAWETMGPLISGK